MNEYLNSRSVKALISTIEPIDGGVPTMTRWMCQVLSEYNITPILAWYSPWRNKPELSVPFYKAIGNTPGYVVQNTLGGQTGYGIGCWLPELEFTHYLPITKWKELISCCQFHITVSGNLLAASPYVINHTPFFAWIATPWEADRKNRVKEFSMPRKTLDTVINKPVIQRLEKKILSSSYGTIITLSKYTSDEFLKISSNKVSDVMLMPIDTEVFVKNNERTIPLKIGFSGRYCDPRKNIELLLQATELIISMGYVPEVVLVGERDSSGLQAKIRELGLEAYISCEGHLQTKELALILQTFDLFIIPSHQEGLCIAALEAMACGVPVISTYCGGPEEFVIPGITGELVESSPKILAETILRICMNREIREKLSEGASEWISKHASQDSSRKIIKQNLISLAEKTNKISQLREVIPPTSY